MDLTGEYVDRNYVITRGDMRLSLTISKNESTSKLNRDTRFLIDDTSSGEALAYSLSKPLRVGNVYEEEGVFKFVLQEVNSTEYDNKELMVADYYKYFPIGKDPDPDPNREGWI